MRAMAAPGRREWQMSSTPVQARKTLGNACATRLREWLRCDSLWIMASSVGIRQVGYFDCAGGGQVVVDKNIAYVGHMHSPHGTSIIDVGDPKNPKELATIGMPQGSHSTRCGPMTA
jgi:hypothetical protein